MSSEKIKFYSNMMSQPSRSLQILMNMAKIPFEPVTVALREGDHLTESFAVEVNSLRTIPCINDDGFKLSGSTAIVRYLAQTTGKIEQWYPSSGQVRGRIDEYLEWHHLNTRFPLSGYFVASWLEPRGTKRPPKPTKLENLRIQANQALDKLENVWLKGDFLIGDSLTVADIWAICEIEELSITPLDAINGRPKLKTWMERVRKATNPFYDDAHRTLWSFSLKKEQKSRL